MNNFIFICFVSIIFSVCSMEAFAGSKDKDGTAVTGNDLAGYWKINETEGMDDYVEIGDTVVYFFENFEGTNFASKGWYDNLHFILDTTEAHNGKSSTKFHWNTGTIFPETGGTMRRKFTETSSLYISYWVKYSDNFTGSNRPYQPHEFYIMTNVDDDYLGPSATHLTVYIEQNERNPVIEINDALNIDASRINQDLSFVTEDRAIAGGNGNGNDEYTKIEYYMLNGSYRNHKTWKNKSVTISNGVWHHVEVRLKLNSISSGKGIGDGILQYWLDGEKVIDKNSVIFRTGQHPDMKFDQFLIGPYLSDGSPVDQSFWVDDLLVADIREAEPSTHFLTVNSGNGSGNYREGAKINISADAPSAGQVFDQWTGDVNGLTGLFSVNTTYKMSAEDAAVTATYKDAIAIENLALNKPTTASVEAATMYKSSKAVDGNPATIWSVGPLPQWLEVDLGDTYTISSTELVFYQSKAYQFVIDVKTSLDGTYVQLVDRSTNTVHGSDSSPIKDNFTGTQARYVRITVTGEYENTPRLISLAEFRVFGLPTGIDQAIQTDKDIHVSPNPANKEITVSVESGWTGEMAQIGIYTLQGGIMYKTFGKVTFPHQIDISSYQPGIYLIRISKGDKYVVQKIVKESY